MVVYRSEGLSEHIHIALHTTLYYIRTPRKTFHLCERCHACERISGSARVVGVARPPAPVGLLDVLVLVVVWCVPVLRVTLWLCVRCRRGGGVRGGSWCRSRRACMSRHHVAHISMCAYISLHPYYTLHAHARESTLPRCVTTRAGQY